VRKRRTGHKIRTWSSSSYSTSVLIAVVRCIWVGLSPIVTGLPWREVGVQIPDPLPWLRYRQLRNCVLYSLAPRVFMRACVRAVDGMLTSADCDDVKLTYRCSNQRCIARHLVNNSVNDCLDNSDEGQSVSRLNYFSKRGKA